MFQACRRPRFDTRPARLIVKRLDRQRAFFLLQNHYTSTSSLLSSSIQRNESIEIRGAGTAARDTASEVRHLSTHPAVTGDHLRL